MTKLKIWVEFRTDFPFSAKNSSSHGPEFMTFQEIG